ncbi:MAG: hypothetical protein EXS25_03065 [Pedosphaera sp.]|nr:hypothetical protein [Pedosphaera sp.]
MRWQFEQFPNLLHPPDRLHTGLHPQAHHAVVPVHPPHHMDQQQSKFLQPRAPVLRLKAHPLDSTEDVVG